MSSGDAFLTRIRTSYPGRLKVSSGKSLQCKMRASLQSPFYSRDANKAIEKLEQQVASLSEQLRAAKDPAGKLLERLGAHELQTAAAPAAVHGYYALHLVSPGDLFARKHVIYIGHQRGTGGAPAYPAALGDDESAGPGHDMWEHVPQVLQKRYTEGGYRLSGTPVLFDSGYGMETVIVSQLRKRLPSAKVEVTESAIALAAPIQLAGTVTAA